MKCAEVRSLVQLYLDSELDSKDSLEVSEHLESCAECAGLFEAEKNFSGRLKSFLRSGPRTVGLWTKIESKIGQPHPIARAFSVFPSRWFAAAAAVLLLFVGGLVWIKAQPLDLAKAAGECHNAYVHRLAAPEFTGAVPHEIQKEFGAELDVA
ncbi:MAG: zf-HC2 domain-containing protein, partial [Verrucomicrobiaceae bacterium]|nr:zf-HC2 domain-containing protein [Verrucomicrobiaceae bacterium]